MKLHVAAGENFTEVGRTFGVSPHSVARVFGPPRRGNGQARKRSRAEEQVIALWAELTTLRGEDVLPDSKRRDPAKMRSRLVELYIERERSKGKPEVAVLEYQIHAMTTLAARTETTEDNLWALGLPLGDDEATTLGRELNRVQSVILNSELKDSSEDDRHDAKLDADRRERGLVIERLQHHLVGRHAERRLERTRWWAEVNRRLREEARRDSTRST